MKMEKESKYVSKRIPYAALKYSKIVKKHGKNYEKYTFFTKYYENNNDKPL